MQRTTDLSTTLKAAAGDLRAKADETSYGDLHEIYLEIARLLDGAGDAFAALQTEVAVLRIERDAASRLADDNAASARAWFDRHEALVKQIAAARAA